MKSRMDENRKVTLTIGQLKKLVRESIQNDEDFEINDGVLVGCHSAKRNIVIPDGVVSIGEDAFYFCPNLTSVIIPDSVTSIRMAAFSGCEQLTSVTIPSSVTSIGDLAFHFCTRLSSMTIPDSVTSIGDSAFWGCRRLTKVVIPNSVTSIGNAAFRNCNNLRSIVVVNEEQRDMILNGKNELPKTTRIIVKGEESDDDGFLVREADDDGSSPAGSDNGSTVKVLFKTKAFSNDKAGEVRFPSINAMVHFLEDIGVEYTAEMADAVVLGKRVQIALPHTIIQLDVQRQ